MPSPFTLNKPSKSWHQPELPQYTGSKQNECFFSRNAHLQHTFALLFSLLSYICTALGLNLDFLTEWGIAIISPHCILKPTPNVGVFLTILAVSLLPHTQQAKLLKTGNNKTKLFGKRQKSHYRGNHPVKGYYQKGPTPPNHLWNLMFLPFSPSQIDYNMANQAILSHCMCMPHGLKQALQCLQPLQIQAEKGHKI